MTHSPRWVRAPGACAIAASTVVATACVSPTPLPESNEPATMWGYEASRTEVLAAVHDRCGDRAPPGVLVPPVVAQGAPIPHTFGREDARACISRLLARPGLCDDPVFPCGGSGGSVPASPASA
jgi:hypothetical protein